jgi:diguanylate cyclase (GGDEF)-like protein
MDQQTVTFILIGVVALTALLIAVSVVAPRLVRRGTGGQAAPAATSAVAATSAPAAMTSRPPGPRIDRAENLAGAIQDTRTWATSDDPGRAHAAGAPVNGAGAPAKPNPAAEVLSPTGWGRILADEDARVRRYRRPATVVMIDVDGLDRLILRLGDGAADRLLPAVADTIRRLAREADHVARLDRGRFGVLLPETDQIQAIHYVERVRRACDLWLESGAVSLRLAIGWASASGDDTLLDAARIANERMYGEIHHNARRVADLVTADLEGDVARSRSL